MHDRAFAPLARAQSKGWLRYKPAGWDDGMGLQVPMALVLDDLPFLDRIDPSSAIARALRRAAQAGELPADFPDPLATSWLAALLEKRPLPLVSSRCYTYDDLRAYMRDVSPYAIEDWDIFKGVSAEEHAELFRASTSMISVLDVPPDTMISRMGDVRDESYIVLRGKVRATSCFAARWTPTARPRPAHAPAETT